MADARHELDAAWQEWQNATLYKQWRKQNPGEALKLDVYRQGGPRPALATATGRALVDETAAWLALAPTPPPGDVVPPGAGTLGLALASAKPGDTIRLAEGTYIENNNAVLMPGVSLIGAGPATIIKGRGAYVLFVGNGADQTISDLTLDGQGRQQKQVGLRVDRAARVKILRVNAHDFLGPPNGGGGAIWANDLSDCELGWLTLRDSANTGTNPNGASGTLGLGNMARCHLHHLTITENYGYCVKNGQTPLGGTGGVEPATSAVSDTTIEDSTFTVVPDTISAWAAISVELWNVVALNSTIRRCKFNRVVSLTNGAGEVTGIRWTIANNHWDLRGGSDYALELHQHCCDVHHNYVLGGLYPIAEFDASQPKNRHNIHHNVFDNQHGPTAAMHFLAGSQNSRFASNTLVMRQASWRDGVFSLIEAGKPASLMAIGSNIFYSTQPIGDKLGLGIDPRSAVDGNGFYNMTQRGTRAVALPATALPLTGGFPNAYMASGIGAMADGPYTVGPEGSNP